jgi:hypothetical protein
LGQHDQFMESNALCHFHMDGHLPNSRLSPVYDFKTHDRLFFSIAQTAVVLIL